PGSKEVHVLQRLRLRACSPHDLRLNYLCAHLSSFSRYCCFLFSDMNSVSSFDIGQNSYEFFALCRAQPALKRHGFSRAVHHNQTTSHSEPRDLSAAKERERGISVLLPLRHNLRKIRNGGKLAQQTLEKRQPIGAHLRILHHHHDPVEKRVHHRPDRCNRRQRCRILPPSSQLPHLGSDRLDTPRQLALRLLLQQARLNRLAIPLPRLPRLPQDVLDPLERHRDGLKVLRRAHLRHRLRPRHRVHHVIRACRQHRVDHVVGKPAHIPQVELQPLPEERRHLRRIPARLPELLLRLRSPVSLKRVREQLADAQRQPPFRQRLHHPVR